jgi:cell division protein FtsB
MDPETLMQKLAELEARNQKLRERNEAIKARLAALK